MEPERRNRYETQIYWRNSQAVKVSRNVNRAEPSFPFLQGVIGHTRRRLGDQSTIVWREPSGPWLPLPDTILFVNLENKLRLSRSPTTRRHSAMVFDRSKYRHATLFGVAWFCIIATDSHQSARHVLNVKHDLNLFAGAGRKACHIQTRILYEIAFFPNNWLCVLRSLLIWLSFFRFHSPQNQSSFDSASETKNAVVSDDLSLCWTILMSRL